MATEPPDRHAHRTLNVPDAPLDAANQSLADALRASFSVLKTIMIVLVVLFMFSGLKCVEEHQKAVVLHLGKLKTDAVRDSGLSWAWPYPVDETLRLGVTAERLNFFEIHTASTESRYGGLNPARDGALLTGDKGLVHAKWSVVYKIDDLPAFVRHVSDANDEKTRELIRTMLEHAAVQAAAQFTAAEISQTRTDVLAREVKRTLAAELAALGTGIAVTTVEIPSADVPLQTRRAFLEVTKAESEKKTKIQEARQKANNLLNETAGAVHPDLIALLDELEIAKSDQDQPRAARLEQELDGMLEEETTGEAGARLREAYGEYTEAVQGIRGDVEQFQFLLAEYQRTPRLLIDRLWQQTRRRILSYPGVTKWYLPARRKQVRMHIGTDPEERRQAEIEQLKKEAGVAPTASEAADFEVVVPEGVE